MEPRSPRFHDKQLAGRRVVPQVLLRLPMGDRYWGLRNPAREDPIGTVLDTSQMTFTQSEYTGVPVLERSPRMISIEPLQETIQPLDQDVLGAWGQAQRTILKFELHNDDRAMSRMVGEEYVLNQPVSMFVGFPGLEWDYSQQRYKGTVNRLTLTKNRLVVEAETLC